MGRRGKKGGCNYNDSACNHSQAGDFVKKHGGKHDAVEGFKAGDDAYRGGPEIFQGRYEQGLWARAVKTMPRIAIRKISFGAGTAWGIKAKMGKIAAAAKKF